MHRLVPTFKSCFTCVIRPWSYHSTLLTRRTFTSSSEESLTEEKLHVNDDFELDPMAEEDGETPRSYRAFMDKIGYQYRLAKPQNWLGGNVPFPMNPSFRPPPPISDYQREIMWQLFSIDSRTFGIRRLAKRFNLSIKRVDAILRLKAMEKDWIKGKHLQSGFVQGMEMLLNAQTHTAIPRMTALLNDAPSDVSVLPSRLDAHKADVLEQEEQRDATPYRYERTYWESIPEDGDEPVLPNILQHVKKQAEVKRVIEEQKKKKHLIKSVPDSSSIRRPKNRVLVKVRERRPSIKFVDIGAEFVDSKELTKRALVAARKSRMRTKKVPSSLKANGTK